MTSIMVLYPNKVTYTNLGTKTWTDVLGRYNSTHDISQLWEPFMGWYTSGADPRKAKLEGQLALPHPAESWKNTHKWRNGESHNQISHCDPWGGQQRFCWGYSVGRGSLWEMSLERLPHSGYHGSRRYGAFPYTSCFCVSGFAFKTSGLWDNNDDSAVKSTLIPSIHSERHTTTLNPDLGRYNTSLGTCIHMHIPTYDTHIHTCN